MKFIKKKKKRKITALCKSVVKEVQIYQEKIRDLVIWKTRFLTLWTETNLVIFIKKIRELTSYKLSCRVITIWKTRFITLWKETALINYEKKNREIIIYEKKKTDIILYSNIKLYLSKLVCILAFANSINVYANNYNEEEKTVKTKDKPLFAAESLYLKKKYAKKNTVFFFNLFLTWDNYELIYDLDDEFIIYLYFFIVKNPETLSRIAYFRVSLVNPKEKIEIPIGHYKNLKNKNIILEQLKRDIKEKLDQIFKKEDYYDPRIVNFTGYKISFVATGENKSDIIKQIYWPEQRYKYYEKKKIVLTRKKNEKEKLIENYEKEEYIF